MKTKILLMLTFWKSQKLVPRKRNQSILIPKIRSRKTTGSPSPKYEHRRASASLRNIQNIRICMGKKTYRFYLNSLWTGLWSSGELGRGESPAFPFPFLAIFFPKQRACSIYRFTPGGYSHILPIRVCAAQRGRDFEAPDLERGIHFRGVF